MVNIMRRLGILLSVYVETNVYYMLLVTSFVHVMMQVAFSTLHLTSYKLQVASYKCMSQVARCKLHVACYMLHVPSCMLQVTSCKL